MRGWVKVATVTKKIKEKRLNWYRHVRRRDEGHVLRRMLDEPGPGKRDGEEDRKPGGKTCVKEMRKVWD